MELNKQVTYKYGNAGGKISNVEPIYLLMHFGVCVLCNSAAMALWEPISNHITHTKAQSKDKHRCLQDWEKGRGFKPLMGLDFHQKGLREDDLTHVNVPLSP